MSYRQHKVSLDRHIFLKNHGEEHNENLPSPCTPTDQIGKRRFEFALPAADNENNIPKPPPTPTKTPARTRRKSHSGAGRSCRSVLSPSSKKHSGSAARSIPKRQKTSPSPLFTKSQSHNEASHNALSSQHKRKKSFGSSKWHHQIHELSAESISCEAHPSPSSSNDSMRDEDDEDAHHHAHKTRKLFHNDSPLHNHSPAHMSSPELYVSLNRSTSPEMPSGMDLSGIHATNCSFQSPAPHNHATPFNLKTLASSPPATQQHRETLSSLAGHQRSSSSHSHHTPPHHRHHQQPSMFDDASSEDSDHSFDSDSDHDMHMMMHDSTPPKYDHSFNKSFDGEFQRVPCRLTNSIVHDNPFSPERTRRYSTSPSSRRQSSGSAENAHTNAAAATHAHGTVAPPPSIRKRRGVFSSARPSQHADHHHNRPAPILEGYFSRYMEDFEEMSILGEGSFGKVTKCKNRFDGMLYAVKQTSRLIKGEKHEANVLREVHALATLVDNPYIVRYYSAWIEDNRLFLQTELCEHGNLYTKFSRKEQFSQDQLLDLLRQVACGLHLMHSASLVHLDIKPENIYMSGTNTYKIGDLGLVASCLERERDLMEGDCRYLSKEILNEEDIQDLSKVDIFALGISLYELALGVRLPENRQEWQDIRAGKLNPFPDRFSNDFVQLVRQMMHIDPQQRPSALELIQHPLVDRNKPSYEDLYRRNKELEQKLALYQREFVAQGLDEQQCT